LGEYHTSLFRRDAFGEEEFVRGEGRETRFTVSVREFVLAGVRISAPLFFIRGTVSPFDSPKELGRGIHIAAGDFILSETHFVFEALGSHEDGSFDVEGEGAMGEGSPVAVGG
jgi:hypothetical protein